jgi:hypothetical protein
MFKDLNGLFSWREDPEQFDYDDNPEAGIL